MSSSCAVEWHDSRFGARGAITTRMPCDHDMLESSRGMSEVCNGVMLPLRNLAFVRLLTQHAAARLAQSAERKALNLVVVGSSPMVCVSCKLQRPGHVYKLKLAKPLRRNRRRTKNTQSGTRQRTTKKTQHPSNFRTKIIGQSADCLNKHKMSSHFRRRVFR